MTGLLRYVRERPWIPPGVLLIVIGVFTLTRHARGHGHLLFWAGVLICAGGVLTAVAGYLAQRHSRVTDQEERPD